MSGIFVTVGTQGPFDRLVLAVDAWARERGRDDVFAQVGKGAKAPAHIGWSESMGPAEFVDRVRSASAVVAHAGMGTIITALEHGRPVVVLPRRAAMGEQRNDHQVDTARRFAELGYVRVAQDETELPGLLDSLAGASSERTVGGAASERLLRRIREFVNNGDAS